VTAGLWTAFLANFLFWTAAAAGGTAFAALVDLTNARWAAPLRATARRCRRFLPLSVALYVVLLIGARRIYPWISHPMGSRWLQFWPFAIRDLFALGAIAAAGEWFWSRSIATTVRAIVFLLAYAGGFSILAIDLVMSLGAPWGSTLFPAYVFFGNMYAATAGVGLVTVSTRRHHEDALTDEGIADLANVLLGFSLLWMYFVWSQYLVIWYGNIGDEVAYLGRLLDGTWRPLPWIIWTARFALPFVVLLPCAGKRRIPVAGVALLIAAGFWGECFLLVAPAASGPPTIAAAIGMTTAFFALFALVTDRQSDSPAWRDAS